MPTRKVTPKYYSTREAATQLGISLTTAQTMVEKGELSAWKTVGGHRRISVESVEKALQNRGQHGARSAGFSILIAEDDPALSTLYEKTMIKWKLPLAVKVVSNGVEAIIQLERLRPDLLILDLKMPRMGGFELLKLIRSFPEHDAMDIVVASGMDSAEIAKRGGLAPGVTQFPKPVQWPQLRGFVQAAVSRRTLGASR